MGREFARWKRDAKAFGISAAGHVLGVGQALGIYDTYQKGRTLANSTRRAAKSVRRRINRQIRKLA